ncbi:LysR family transcriptional regulator [Blautia wexlerae]|nr:LysR family transcriptional regulator [Blautia wexlerae]
MTLQQIKHFINVAESGSISEAAKRLFTAQSSISSAVKIHMELLHL